jgi:hypothetical protein
MGYFSEFSLSKKRIIRECLIGLNGGHPMRVTLIQKSGIFLKIASLSLRGWGMCIVGRRRSNLVN